ncbi:MAG TPA: M48 family metalloprotease [Natronosporangium sp.]|nr:M48 family metalloprotease [Natronosporangium sp.]
MPARAAQVRAAQVRAAQRAGAAAPRLTASRPGYFPSGFAWLVVGVSRRWRGVFTALISTWLGVPFALFMAVLCAVLFGILGAVGGTAAGLRWVPPWVGQVPLLGSAVDSLLPSAGGVVGLLVGVLVGLLLGFLGALTLLWWTAFAEDPLTGFGALLLAAVVGVLVGLGYTLYRTTLEPTLLRGGGARRMSRRERDLIIPILRSCAQRLGLSDYPPVLIDDSSEPSAITYTRHIVLSRGLLVEFDYDPEVIGGVLSHALVHWRNGDAVGAAFVRGVALPLYFIYAGLRWFTRRVEERIALALASSLLILLMWMVFWPVVVTVRFLVMPVQAAAVRRAEFRADQGAVLTGHRDGLRRVLARLPHSFERGRNGWDLALCAAHPANELRLERLEDEAGSYPLPGSDRPTDSPPAPASARD